MTLSSITGPLDQDSPQPLYQQLRETLRGAIDAGHFKSRDALPAERDIAADYGVSRITVRKAIDGLAEEGLLDRRHGSGTFVASHIEKSFSLLSSFSEDIAARGWEASSEWIDRSQGTVTPEEALALGCAPGARVYRFGRIRYAEGMPLALEYSTIPADCLPSLDAIDVSLYEALARTGCRPTKALQRLQAVAFDADQAATLGVPVGAPGLLIDRHGFLDDGRAVELTRSWYRGDAYDFVAEMSV